MRVYCYKDFVLYWNTTNGKKKNLKGNCYLHLFIKRLNDQNSQKRNQFRWMRRKQKKNTKIIQKQIYGKKSHWKLEIVQDWNHTIVNRRYTLLHHHHHHHICRLHAIYSFVVLMYILIHFGLEYFFIHFFICSGSSVCMCALRAILHLFGKTFFEASSNNSSNN